MTKLYYFSGKNQKKSTQTLNIIENIVPKSNINIYTTIENFSKSLRKYRDDKTIVVILTGTLDELLNILLLKDLIKNLPLLLILPDEKKETVSKGTMLQPRFMCSMNDDLSQLDDILKKMIEKYYG